MVWCSDDAGVLSLPSGRQVRGRSLRVQPATDADWSLYLLGHRPPPQHHRYRWVRWRDFWLPAASADALSALEEAWRRSADERVELVCGGGVGRTGTGLAVLTMLDGLSPGDAITYVRAGYHPRAVETPWQRAWLARHRP